MGASQGTSQGTKPEGMTSLTQYGSLVGILVALVGIGLGANWVYHLYYPEAPALLVFADPNEYINALNASVSAQTIPSGLAQELADSRIYLMLANKGSAFVRPHVFEKEIFSTPGTTDADGGYYTTSPDGKWLSFIVERSSTGIVQDLYRYPAASLEGAAFPSSLEDEFIIPDDQEVRYKRLPAISDAGELLVVGWRHTDDVPFAHASVHYASEWSIYHITEGGDTTLLTDGYSPRWLNDSTFLFLKDEGLFVYDMDTEEGRLLVPTDIVTLANNRIDISNDGTLLAWVQPDAQITSVYTLTQNGGEIAASLRGTLPVRGFWVAMSPSSNYFVMQAIRFDATGSEASPEPKLLFFDARDLTDTPLLSVELDAFEQQHMFMTEWSFIR